MDPCPLKKKKQNIQPLAPACVNVTVTLTTTSDQDGCSNKHGRITTQLSYFRDMDITKGNKTKLKCTYKVSRTTKLSEFLG